jgi:RNA polymerase sigma factor (sigma-70 family)
MKAMQAVAISPPPIMDRKRFTELIREHHLTLLSYARALAGAESTARELVQDAFVAAWQSLGKFEVTRDFAAWMRGIVRNKWREHCRLHSREVPFDDDALSRLEETLAPHSSGDALLFARLAECREKLPPPMSEALRVTYDEGRTSDDAAALLSLNPAALRKRLERARDALRLCLSKND